MDNDHIGHTFPIPAVSTYSIENLNGYIRDNKNNRIENIFRINLRVSSFGVAQKTKKN